MRKLIINIVFISVVPFNYVFAGENSLILASGINHRFMANSVSKVNLNNYSVSFQYSRSISNYFSIGVKAMMDNLKPLNEYSNQDLKDQSMLLLTINHYLLDNIDDFYIQFGGGTIIDFGTINSEYEHYENYTGYCFGLATGTTFSLHDNIGVSFEMGLTYKKFSQNVYINSNSQLVTNILIGMLLDF